MYASIRCTSYTQCRPTHPIPVQCWDSVATHCWLNAGQSYSTLANIYTELGDCPLFALTAIRVTHYAPKGHYPDNALVTFHKRGLPGLFLAVTHGTRRDLDRVPSIFNSNLKIARAPARNKPWIKPVNCPERARRGPCRDSPGTRGQFFKENM